MTTLVTEAEANRLAVEALDFLEAKGYATTIANYLSDHDYGGQRHNATSCPLATYLSEKAGVPVVVGGESFAVMALDSPDERPPYHAIGKNVRQFVRLFDQGVYPDLDMALRD